MPAILNHSNLPASSIISARENWANNGLSKKLAITAVAVGVLAIATFPIIAATFVGSSVVIIEGTMIGLSLVFMSSALVFQLYTLTMSHLVQQVQENSAAQGHPGIYVLVNGFEEGGVDNFLPLETYVRMKKIAKLYEIVIVRPQDCGQLTRDLNLMGGRKAIKYVEIQSHGNAMQVCLGETVFSKMSVNQYAASMKPVLSNCEGFFLNTCSGGKEDSSGSCIAKAIALQWVPKTCRVYGARNVQCLANQNFKVSEGGKIELAFKSSLPWPLLCNDFTQIYTGQAAAA